MHPGWILCLAVLITLSFSPASKSQSIKLDPATLSSGASASSGGGIVLFATLGQPIIGITGTTVRTGQGFWYVRGGLGRPASLDGPAIAHRVSVGAAYPNPATAAATLAVQVYSETHLRVELCDLLGRVRVVAHDSRVRHGTLHLHLDGATLPGGHYLLRVMTDEGQQTLPLTFIH